MDQLQSLWIISLFSVLSHFLENSEKKDNAFIHAQSLVVQWNKSCCHLHPIFFFIKQLKMFWKNLCQIDVACPHRLPGQRSCHFSFYIRHDVCSSLFSSAKGRLGSVHLGPNLSDWDTNRASQQWLSGSKSGESACVLGWCPELPETLWS